MYREFFIIAFDFLKNMKFRNFMFEIVLPIFFSSLGVFFLSRCTTEIKLLEIFNSLASNILSVLSILVGFALTLITVLISSDKFTKVKSYMTNYKIDGKFISLYKYMIINTSYTALLEFFLISLNIFFISFSNSFLPVLVYISMFINVTLCTHLLFLSIRSFTDLYNVIMSNK